MAAFGLVRATLLASALAVPVSAAGETVEPSCPEEAVLYGAAPPAGSERYCGKPVNGGRVLRHGWYASWFPNGRKGTEGQYAEGLRSGTWWRWWDDGARFEEVAFVRGKQEGPYRSWHRNGRESASGAYRAGWQDGPWVFWHESGARAAEGPYADGLQQGCWSYWRENGQMQGSGTYRDGLMQGPGTYRDGLMLGTAGPAGASTASVSLAADVPDLEIAVDPRIELMSALLSLTLWPELGPWTDGGTDYARDMRAAFAAFREHRAVRTLDRLVQEGFTFDVPLRWILHYGPPPALEPRTPLDPYVLRRAGSERVLADLASAARDFARDARFVAFFDRHAEYYRRLANAYRAAAPRGVPALLEGYFGSRKQGYRAVIAPLLGTRAYSFRVGGPPGTGHETLVSVGAPQRQEGSHFSFDPASVRGTLYRDFNRPFSQPAVERAFGTGYRTDLYPPAKPAMDDLGLPTWRWALTEMAARACEIRLLRLHGFEEEARLLLRQGTGHERFFWLPYAVDRLGEYERQRGTYADFGAFGGRFLGVLDDTDPVTIAGTLMFLLFRPGAGPPDRATGNSS